MSVESSTRTIYSLTTNKTRISLLHHPSSSGVLRYRDFVKYYVAPDGDSDVFVVKSDNQDEAVGQVLSNRAIIPGDKRPVDVVLFEGGSGSATGAAGYAGEAFETISNANGLITLTRGDGSTETFNAADIRLSGVSYDSATKNLTLDVQDQDGNSVSQFVVPLTDLVDNVNLARLVSGQLSGTDLNLKRDDNSDFSVDLSGLVQDVLACYSVPKQLDPPDLYSRSTTENGPDLYAKGFTDNFVLQPFSTGNIQFVSGGQIVPGAKEQIETNLKTLLESAPFNWTIDAVFLKIEETSANVFSLTYFLKSPDLSLTFASDGFVVGSNNDSSVESALIPTAHNSSVVAGEDHYQNSLKDGVSTWNKFNDATQAYEPSTAPDLSLATLEICKIPEDSTAYSVEDSSQTVDLVALTPLTVTASNLSDIRDVCVFDSAGVMITSSVEIVKTGDNQITIEANQSLTGVEVNLRGTK